LVLRDLFFHHVAQTSPSPLALEIVQARGCELTNRDGKKYLDLISGISVSNLGHGHPAIIDAIKKQTDEYLHLMVYGEMIESPQVLLAKRLSELLPKNLSCTYFVNSGAEAVEGALKLAKRYTARNELVTFRNAYHGSTLGALSVCGNEELKNAFRPLIPDVRILNYNSFDDLTQITKKTACVIVEPIQAEAGVILPAKGFLKAIRERCTETGSLLIFDEIQTAMGRTGRLFAFEDEDVIPDILLLAKAFGGGMPLGAFISSKEIMSVLTHHPVLGHITTFGGHPVCCAAALASLDEMNEGLLASVAKKEKSFREQINSEHIKQIRGKGLLLCLQFKSEEMNKKIIHSCIENGVIVDWFLFAPDCMRIAPPLIINEAEIGRACAVINKSIDNNQ